MEGRACLIGFLVAVQKVDSGNSAGYFEVEDSMNNSRLLTCGCSPSGVLKNFILGSLTFVRY
jgi:hypothetical protein